MEHKPPSFPNVTNEECESADPDELTQGDSGVYRVTFDSDTDSVCQAIASTVAVISGTDPVELSPIYSVIDADALETLANPSKSGTAHSDIHISFTYEGFSITVQSYGVIAIEPIE